MDEKRFWQLLEDLCQLGEFIALIETKGAEINIVGRFQVAHDGHEMLLEKQACKDHFHLLPEQIHAIHFGYCKVSTGREDPCIDLINKDREACLRLFYFPYQASELEPRYEQFMAQHEPLRAYLSGVW